MLGFLPVGMALLRAVDAAEADAFMMLGVQNLDGVAVEDADNLAGEVGVGGSGMGPTEEESQEPTDDLGSQ